MRRGTRFKRRRRRRQRSSNKSTETTAAAAWCAEGGRGAAGPAAGPRAAAGPPSARGGLLPQLLRQLVQVDDLQELVEVQLALRVRVHRAEGPRYVLRADAGGQDQDELLQLFTRQGHGVVWVSVDGTFRESVLEARVQIHNHLQRFFMGCCQLFERHLLVQFADHADLVCVDPSDELVELNLAAAVPIDSLEPRLELRNA